MISSAFTKVQKLLESSEYVGYVSNSYFFNHIIGSHEQDVDNHSSNRVSKELSLVIFDRIVEQLLLLLGIHFHLSRMSWAVYN